MVKNLPANARDMGLIPGSGRSPGVGNGDLFQYTCLENPMDEEPGRLQCMKFQFAVSLQRFGIANLLYFSSSVIHCDFNLCFSND